MNDEWRSLRKDKNLDRHWSYVYQLTREKTEAWEQALKKYTDLLKSGYSVTAAQAAVEADDPLGLLAGLPWKEADQLIRDLAQPLSLSTAARAGVAELARLKIGLRFDLDNPYATRWATDHSATLVRQVGDETKKAIRAVMGEAFEAGVPPRRAALRIRELIGLTERDARAVMNYWRTLTEEADLSARRADDMADSYARRLWRRRALTIARTETIAASAAGTQQSWAAAKDKGFLPFDTKQEWVAAMESRRTCPICRALDGQKVALGEPFQSSTLGAVMAPPAHVSCRCALGAVTEVAEKRFWPSLLRVPG